MKAQLKWSAPFLREASAEEAEGRTERMGEGRCLSGMISEN